jgi:hypothetical protein
VLLDERERSIGIPPHETCFPADKLPEGCIASMAGIMLSHVPWPIRVEKGYTVSFDVWTEPQPLVDGPSMPQFPLLGDIVGTDPSVLGADSYAFVRWAEVPDDDVRPAAEVFMDLMGAVESQVGGRRPDGRGRLVGFDCSLGSKERFGLIELWESKGHHDRFEADVLSRVLPKVGLDTHQLYLSPFKVLSVSVPAASQEHADG